MDGYNWSCLPVSTGTTILAAEYQGGVVLGADTRTTTGPYVANRVTDKISQITDNIYVCRSGSAADTQALSEVAKYQIGLHSMERGKETLVQCGAKVLRELCYNYRDQVTVGIIVGGWDHAKQGQVYSIPIGGMCVRQPIAVGGSGSAYIYGYIDAHYEKGMDKEECIEFIVNAITLAIGRDTSSGGCVRLAVIDKHGCERQIVEPNYQPRFGELMDFEEENA